MQESENRCNILKKHRNLKRDASMDIALWSYYQKIGPADYPPGRKENNGKEHIQNSGKGPGKLK